MSALEILGTAATFAGAIVIASMPWLLQHRSDAHDEKAACEALAYTDLLSAAVGVTMAMGSLALQVKGSDSAVKRAIINTGAMLGTRGRALEPIELHDWLWKSVGPLLYAWSRASAYGREQHGFALANDLVAACMDLLSKLEDRSDGFEDRILSKSDEIGRRRNALAAHLREKLDLSVIDLTPPASG